MIPDLGKYAVAVLSSYGVSVGLMLGLVALTYVQGRKVKRHLADVEARQGKTNG